MTTDENEAPSNPFLKSMDWHDPRSMNGRSLAETLYPLGSTVQRMAPLKDDPEKRMRFSIKSPSGEDLATYTCGDNIEELLPADLMDEFCEAVERVTPYYAQYFAATEALNQAYLLRGMMFDALQKTVPKELLAQKGYCDFRARVFGGQLEIMTAEMTHTEAKIKYLLAYIEAVLQCVVHNAQAWFGCPIPIAVRSSPQENSSIMMSLEVGSVLIAQDGSCLDYQLDLDCRWSVPMFVAAVYPEMARSPEYAKALVAAQRGRQPSRLIL